MKAFWVQMIYLYLVFQFVEERCHGNQLILGKCHERRLIPLAFFALLFKNELQYRCLNVRTNSGDDVAISCKNLVNFCLVTPEIMELIWERQVRHGQKNRRISLNIPGHSGRIFAILLPYESTLCADDGSVLIFQFVKGRCHGNQIMLDNEGKLILRALFARLPDGSPVLVCYYLLGGYTAAPSGLYARLCHAFLVIKWKNRDSAVST